MTFNFDAVYTVDKEFSKDTFMKAVLVYLGTRGETPVDVVDAEFGEVEEYTREVIVCTASVTGHCTASIGYDHQESYTAYESYREKVGNDYVTRQRPVTRYRTVTDWQVFQTEYEGKATCAADNCDDFGEDDSRIVHAIKTANTDSFREEGYATVNLKGMGRVLAACEFNVERSRVSFPGDRYRDAMYNSKSEVEMLCCYKLPCYEVTYTYDGRDYTVSAFACGEIELDAETPPNDVDVTAVVKKKTRLQKIGETVSWLLFTLSLVGAAVACFWLKFGWLFPVPIVLLLNAQISSIIYRKKYKARSKELSENLSDSKIAALKAALARHGYSPQGREFRAMPSSCSTPKAEELKSVKARAIWCWILTVILTISSLITIYSAHRKNLHSPEQLEVKVLSKDEEYDPDVSPYINGCYYIHFEYEIEAKKTGIEYIELKMHVKEKDGDDLGFIRSSLSYLELEAGETDTITVTLHENQPEKNEFFTELYNADFDDLEFEYEIGTIRFSDGKYYNNPDYDKFN